MTSENLATYWTQSDLKGRMLCLEVWGLPVMFTEVRGTLMQSGRISRALKSWGGEFQGRSSGSAKRSKDNRKTVGNPSHFTMLRQDGGSALLRNVGKLQPEYTASSKNTVFLIVTAVRTSNLTCTPNTICTEGSRQTAKPRLGTAWIRMWELRIWSSVLSIGMYRHVVHWNPAGVPEEFVASIFRVSQARNQNEAGSKQGSAGLSFYSEDGGHTPLKRRLYSRRCSAS
jgi:hypothetical protein